MAVDFPNSLMFSYPNHIIALYCICFIPNVDRGEEGWHNIPAWRLEQHSSIDYMLISQHNIEMFFNTTGMFIKTVQKSFTLLVSFSKSFCNTLVIQLRNSSVLSLRTSKRIQWFNQAQLIPWKCQVVPFSSICTSICYLPYTQKHTTVTVYIIMMNLGYVKSLKVLIIFMLTCSQLAVTLEHHAGIALCSRLNEFIFLIDTTCQKISLLYASISQLYA